MSDDLELYLETVYGPGEGRAHIGVGVGQYVSDKGKFKHRQWRESSFAWPTERASLVKSLTQVAAAGADVYVCPYLMHGRKRAQGAAVGRPVVHADCDGDLDPAKVKELDGFAVASGSEGHGHVYVRLSESVPGHWHRALCVGLRDFLGNADAKISDNDVLRPPETLNFKGPTFGTSDEPAPVEWLVEPTGVAVEPQELAERLGVTLPDTTAQSGAGSTSQTTEAVDLGALPQSVKDALAEVTGDRSTDTMRVVGACHDAGLTLPQARHVVGNRADLAQRLRERTDDDVLTCWLKATDSRAGWSPDQSEAATPAPAPADKRSVASHLVDLALTRWRFGISVEGDAFALPLEGAQVVRMLTGSRSIRAELADIFQATTRKVAGQQALADAVLVLEGRARRTEPVSLALRVAYSDGAAWLDAGTLTGEAIKITPAGWEVVAAPPILFRRTALTGSLPAPVPGGTLAELWTLINVAPDSRPILLAWLVSALLPDIPHPIAALVGEQGTGKSTASRMLSGLLDPSPAQLRKPPRDVDAWVTAAAGSWVVGVDNLSTVADWWSDALCRAVTGDGDVRRRLYSDADLTVFSFRRVVLVNGIDLGAVRDDLAERLLTVELQRITQHRREAAIEAEWERAHPRILGALLTLAATVLALLPVVKLLDPPRMADFAQVLKAVDLLMSTSGLETYKSLASNLAADAVTGDPVLTAITDSIDEPWEGTAAILLARLGGGPKGDKSWPKNARAMTTVLRRRAPSLRRVGWTVDCLGRQGKGCALRFRLEPPSDPPADAPSRPATDSGEASERQATGKQEASETDDACPVACLDTPLRTCEDAEMADEASKASKKSLPLLLDQNAKREGEGDTEGIREGPDSSLAPLAPPALCPDCAQPRDDAPLASCACSDLHDGGLSA